MARKQAAEQLRRDVDELSADLTKRKAEAARLAKDLRKKRAELDRIETLDRTLAALALELRTALRFHRRPWERYLFDDAGDAIARNRFDYLQADQELPEEIAILWREGPGELVKISKGQQKRISPIIYERAKLLREAKRRYVIGRKYALDE